MGLECESHVYGCVCKVLCTSGIISVCVCKYVCMVGSVLLRFLCEISIRDSQNNVIVEKQVKMKMKNVFIKFELSIA